MIQRPATGPASLIIASIPLGPKCYKEKRKEVPCSLRTLNLAHSQSIFFFFVWHQNLKTSKPHVSIKPATIMVWLFSSLKLSPIQATRHLRAGDKNHRAPALPRPSQYLKILKGLKPTPELPEPHRDWQWPPCPGVLHWMTSDHQRAWGHSNPKREAD